MAENLFGNYDPGAVVITFKEHQIIGLAKGSFVEAERTEDGFKMETGAQDDTVRIRVRNSTGMVQVTTLQISPSNTALSAYAEADEAGGDGVGPIMVEDLAGNSLAFAEKAWVRKIPKMGFADDHTPTVWIFDCAKLKILNGGNAT